MAENQTKDPVDEEAVDSAPETSPAEADEAVDAGSDEESQDGTSAAKAEPNPWEPLPDEPPTAFQLRRVNHVLGLAESGLLAFLMITLVVNGMLQVFGMAGNHISAYTEVLRFNVFWVAIFGAALAAQRNRLISMDVFARMMPPKVQAMLRIALGLFTIGVCALLFDGGNAVREIASSEPYDLIPKGVGLLAIPVGAGLIGFHVLVHALIDAAYLAKGRTAPVEEAPSH